MMTYIYMVRHRQVHKLEDGTIAVFSRNSEDMSKKYPDLMEQLPRVRCLLCRGSNRSVHLRSCGG